MTGFRIRPYEVTKGETDRVIKQSVGILEGAFLGEKPLEKTVMEVVNLFDSINFVKGDRPKVGLFGDFYVCDNDLMNQKLTRVIEESGGEIITTPYSDLVRMSLDNVIRRRIDSGEYFTAAKQRLIGSGLKLLEDKFYRYFEKYLGLRKQSIRVSLNPILPASTSIHIIPVNRMTIFLRYFISLRIIQVFRCLFRPTPLSVVPHW